MGLAKVENWEENLNAILRKVDIALEREFPDVATRHPVRPPSGTTASPQYDGLFRVTASFTAGFGSQLGRGYSIQVDCMSLNPPDSGKMREIESRAVQLITDLLPEAFPGRQLEVKQDGTQWKIVGDLSL